MQIILFVDEAVFQIIDFLRGSPGGFRRFQQKFVREQITHVFRYAFLRRTVEKDFGVFEEDHPFAALLDSLRIVRNQQQRHAFFQQGIHPGITFALKSGVADRQSFVDDENVRFHQNLHGKSQTHHHAAGIGFDRLVDEVADVGKIHNFLIFRRGFACAQSQDSRIHVDVFPSGEFRIESAAQFQQSRDFAVNFHTAGSRTQNPGQDLKQGAFSRAVLADNAHTFPAADIETDVPESPELPVEFLGPRAQSLKQPVNRLLVYFKTFGYVFYGNDNIIRGHQQTPSSFCRTRPFRGELRLCPPAARSPGIPSRAAVRAEAHPVPVQS